MEEFKKYYEFPLKQDPYGGNVIASNASYMMAFDWIENDWISEYPIGEEKGAQLAQHIVDYLNGITEYRPDFVWEHNKDDVCIINMNGQPAIDVRGWGSLCGELNSVDEAARIQDQFIEFIINTLNN